MPGGFRFGDTRHIVSDVSRLQALGWEPTTRLRGIVERYAAWAETQPGARDYYEEAEAVMKRTGTVRSAAVKAPAGITGRGDGVME